ncbi:hypothetical protein M9458_025779, partial [Cirrhinus mrigala]
IPVSYQYRVMPYGLSISPSVFQTFMNEVFREFLHRFVVVYIDDILIYSGNLAEHRQHVQQVLHKLRDHSLYLKLEKCEFHCSSVQFLGYIISAEGMQMDQGKVSAIQEWPQPLTVKELQRFLGFSNFYRRFIKDYSSITATLTSLLRGKPKTLNWNPSAHEAFQQLKKIFSTAPLLHHPDPELPFTVEVDASTTGVGAVLSQAVGEPPLLHPCAFYSCKLSPAEQNYDVGNRELLAIKLALEEWRHWLEGSTHPFTIITYHKNLQYLREARRLNPRQARWALFFTRFNFKITYRSGSKNTSADALSRQFSSDQPVEPKPIIPSNLIVSPILWEMDNDIRNATLQESAPPESSFLKPNLIILWALDTPAANGHSCSYNPNTGGPVCTIRYVQSCSVCAMSTSPRQLPTDKLVPLPIPQRPWSHIGVDFVTNLPAAEGNSCILVMVDRFSKMYKLFPLKGLPAAMEMAELLFQQLRSCQTGELNSSLTRFLPWAEYTQNSLRQDATGLTPFQCVLGYQPPLFLWMKEPSNVPAVDHWFRESERVWDSAHNHLQRAVRQRKRFADIRRRPAPDYQPGDQVWLSTRDLRLRQPCRKLSPRYIGPFKILRRINDVTFQLQLPPRYRVHPTFHVSLLKPIHPSATETPGAEVEPPPPEVLDPPSIYTVHEILDSRHRGSHLEYLVDWEGYGPEERSWVPRDDILDPTLLLGFRRSHPDRPAPRGRGRWEVPLEEGVVSGIHHSHLLLTHLWLHHPLDHHHQNTNNMGNAVSVTRPMTSLPARLVAAGASLPVRPQYKRIPVEQDGLFFVFTDSLSGVTSKAFRKCADPCPRYLTPDDTHDLCVFCLGEEHARDVLEGAKAPKEGQPPVPRGSGPSAAEARRKMSSWGSQVDLADELKKGTFPFTCLLADDDVVSLTSSDPAAKEQEMLEDEEAEAEPSLISCPAYEELLEVMECATVRLDLPWERAREVAPRGRLDERYRSDHNLPAQVSLPFLPDLHTEIEKVRKRPFSSRIHNFPHSNYANIEGMREHGYQKMPPVEETLASYLSVGKASSLKTPSLPSIPLQVTSCLNGRAYAAAGQAVGALHTMAVLQAYQADLLKDLDKGQGLFPDEVAELRRTTDLALRATKQAATAMGRSMGAMVVTERHLWVNLADLGKKERGFLLDAPVSPSELFGTSVETVFEKFREAKGRSAAFQTFIPRRSRSEPEQYGGPGPQAQKTSVATRAPPPPAGGSGRKRG